MAYASYPQGGANGPVQPSFSEPKGVIDTKKTLAKCFGYMALGLFISAATAFLVSVGFVYWMALDADTAFVAYSVVSVISIIGVLVDGFIVNLVIAKNKRSAWVPYILFSVLMGICLSSFLLAGIDFLTVANAFGITSMVFLVMFLIGYFSKANLNIFAMILSMIAMLAFGFAGLWGLTILITGNPWSMYVYDMTVSGAIMILAIFSVSIDAYNIKQLIAKGGGMKNLALFCAYSMYCDFVVILVRVLLILASAKDNKNN